MRYLQHLPLWRDATGPLLAIEQAVRHFPRYHKYALGAEPRRQARQVERLTLAVDDLKVLIQLGKELEAFRRFDEFEAIARLAVAVGRQSAGEPAPTGH